MSEKYQAGHRITNNQCEIIQLPSEAQPQHQPRQNADTYRSAPSEFKIQYHHK
jgi:hypothetical protein